MRGAVTRFTVPEKLNTGRPSAVSMPRIKMIERPAADEFTGALDQLALVDRVDELGRE